MKDAIRDAIWRKFLHTKNYTDFSNRKSKTREYLAVLAVDLDRRTRFVLSECTAEIQDKITCI